MQFRKVTSLNRLSPLQIKQAEAWLKGEPFIEKKEEKPKEKEKISPPIRKPLMPVNVNKKMKTEDSNECKLYKDAKPNMPNSRNPIINKNMTAPNVAKENKENDIRQVNIKARNECKLKWEKEHKAKLFQLNRDERSKAEQEMKIMLKHN